MFANTWAKYLKVTVFFRVIGGLYDHNGYCLPIKEVNYEQSPLSQPTRLVWDIDPTLGVQIDRAITTNQKVIVLCYVPFVL